MSEEKKGFDMELRDVKKLLNEILMNDKPEDVMMNIIEEYEDSIRLKRNEECLIVVMSDVDERGDYKSESWAKFVSEFLDVIHSVKANGCKELWVHAHSFALFPKGVKPLLETIERNFASVKLMVPSAVGGGVGLALLLVSDKVYSSDTALFGPFLPETQTTRLYGDHISLGLFKKTLESVADQKDLDLWSSGVPQYKTELEETLSLLEALIVSRLYSKSKCPIQEIVNRLLKTAEHLALPLSAKDIADIISNVEILSYDSPMLNNMIRYNLIFKTILRESPYDVMICSKEYCAYW